MSIPPATLEIIIHHLEQARGVLSAAKAFGHVVQLRSAPDASAYAGVGYLHALGEALGHELLIDCHDDPGLVMAALRTGCRKLIYSGSKETHQRLSEMAEQLGAEIRLETAHSPLQLTLSPDDDGEEQARRWLSSL